METRVTLLLRWPANGEQAKLCSTLFATVDFLFQRVSLSWNCQREPLEVAFWLFFCSVFNQLEAGIRRLFDIEEQCSFHDLRTLQGAEGPVWGVAEKCLHH